MKRIRVLKIVFDAVIQAFELPALRGALIEKTKRERILFHNHITDSKLRYAYPLIQYKMAGKKASMICLDEGTEEITALLDHFGNKPILIRLGNRGLNLGIEKIQAEYFNVGINGHETKYQLRNWIGLNQPNYEIFQQIPGTEQKVVFLEGIIAANILAFFKGVGLFVDQPIIIRINEITGDKIVKYKRMCLKAYDLEFHANVNLPLGIGLGKGVSLGFGRILSANRH